MSSLACQALSEGLIRWGIMGKRKAPTGRVGHSLHGQGRSDIKKISCVKVTLCTSRFADKPIQRNAANARERSRMRTLSKAFCKLKTTLPWVPADTKLSKLDTLRLASCYISYLKEVLEEPEDQNRNQTKTPKHPMTMAWPILALASSSHKISDNSVHDTARKPTGTSDKANDASDIAKLSKVTPQQNIIPPYTNMDWSSLNHLL